jgi:aryl-alcohol dehydrogenase-like predicted oxidoreductase
VINRRKFLGFSGSAVLAASLPVSSFSGQQERIPARLIPGTDEKLPVIGLGNSQSFRNEDLDAAAKLIDVFLEHGGGYVDAGGVSAMVVGRIAQDKNASDRLFIGNYLDPNDANAMRQEAVSAAEGQGKDALDLVHTRNLAGYRSQHDRYRQMKEDGLVRYIGVARTGADGFDAIGQLVEDGLVDFIQINYSLVEPEAADRLLPLAADKGVAVSISRPFINGRYFGMVSGIELPDWVADFDCDSWAQFSLKFIIAHPAVNCVLTETANPKHALDNLGAGYGRLPDAATQQKMRDLIAEI